VICLFDKKILILVSKNGKKIILLLSVVTIVTIMVNAIIFAGHSNNPLVKKNIIIDAGHGGVDSGTTDYSTFFEKNVNLQIAQKLQRELINENAVVAMTRDADYSLDNKNKESSSRHKRDLIARVNEFNSGKYDLFLSIHVNRSSNTNAIGPIVLYSTKYPSTEVLARCMQDRLNEYIQNVIGVKVKHKAVSSDYYVLENANIPGIIIETGFISNPKEKIMLTNEQYQSKLIKYIKNGVKDYLKEIQNINRDGSKNDPQKNNIENEEQSLPSNVNSDIEIVLN
jgi:N-acetylmuramoyl-L-alanine amidase